jgi:hypothetical protein
MDPKDGRLWSKSEEEFVKNWSGPRAKAAVALNVEFGRSRTEKAVGVKIRELREEENGLKPRKPTRNVEG